MSYLNGSALFCNRFHRFDFIRVETAYIAANDAVFVQDARQAQSDVCMTEFPVQGAGQRDANCVLLLDFVDDVGDATGDAVMRATFAFDDVRSHISDALRDGLLVRFGQRSVMRRQPFGQRLIFNRDGTPQKDLI